MNQKSKTKHGTLILVVLVFLASNVLCGEMAHFSKQDAIDCGTLIKECDGVEEVIWEGVKRLNQEVKGEILYYDFYDCTLDEFFEFSCGADCSVYIR